MGRAARGTVVLAAAMLALAPVAGAQSGNGLYEPFPKAAVEKRAKRFVERLPLAESVTFSDSQLQEGAFVDPRAVSLDEGLGQVPPAAASARAGAGGERGSGVPAVVQVLLVVLAVAALPLLAGRRPGRRVAAG
jgi:hypothetical protein